MVEFKIHSLAFTSCSRLLKHVTIVPDVPLAPAVYVALHLQCTQHTQLVNCSFHDNNGTALVVNNTNITLTGNTEFTHNRACGNIIAGGGIIALSSNLQFTGSTTFLDNSAIPERQCPLYRLVYTFGGGAIFASQNTVLTFSGTSNFTNNIADFSGAIYTDSSMVRFNGTNHFINNSAYHGNGGAIATNSTVLTLNGTSQFINNSARIGKGGAIYTMGNSNITFIGTININNNGYNDGVNEYNLGGGMYVGPKSTFSIFPNTTVY